MNSDWRGGGRDIMRGWGVQIIFACCANIISYGARSALKAPPPHLIIGRDFFLLLSIKEACKNWGKKWGGGHILENIYYKSLALNCSIFIKISLNVVFRIDGLDYAVQVIRGIYIILLVPFFTFLPFLFPFITLSPNFLTYTVLFCVNCVSWLYIKPALLCRT